MKQYYDEKRNVRIRAADIHIGENVTFGSNIDVNVKGVFSIGNYSRLGDDVNIRGNNIIFGKHLFHSSGLRIGGGGRENMTANLTCGDRCTIHNNFINVCEPIKIGNDVGLSPETSILSHGYWMSVLEGYPAAFEGVEISDGVIVGYRSLIMMGVAISAGCVIGAQSVVTKNIREHGIYGGNPARFIREIKPLSTDARIKKMQDILEAYKRHNASRSIEFFEINLDFPLLRVDSLEINVETFEYDGEETRFSDDARDFLRKYGIRIYTERPFKSL